MERELYSNIQLLPPGFRFHPSDEELIVHYLRNKATSNPLPASIIAEVDLYKCSPWELPNKALFGEEEWYFFTPRDRKYPNGVRPNRMAVLGYWKATGTDKPILTSREEKIIGLKKALVFYKGRPPRGVKTDWIMHEYRLPESTTACTSRGSMRLDDWVLCRVRLKSSIPRRASEEQYSSRNEQAGQVPKADKPNLDMTREHLYKDCPMLPYIFSYPELPPMDTVSTISFKGSKASTTVCEDNSGSKYWQCSVTHFDSQFNARKRGCVEGNQTEGSIPTKRKLNNRDEQTEQDVVAISSDTREMNFNGVEQAGYVNNFNAMEFYNPISIT